MWWIKNNNNNNNNEVRTFKDDFPRTTPENNRNQEQLLDDITILKDHLRQKGKVIDSSSNQLSQQNDYVFQKRNADTQHETRLENIKSKETEILKTAEINS